MNKQVNYEMIEFARELRGITQKELAERTCISQGHISKLERGEWSITESMLRVIAEVLEFPESFFSKKIPRFGFELSYIYHRKRQSIPRHILKKVEAEASLKVMQIDCLLDSIELDSPNEFISMDIQDYNQSPEQIAQLLRAKWKLPMGPISNLTEVIENAGGFVFVCDFCTQKLDGLSTWSRITPPVFFINQQIPTDRFRFSLSHELGHIVMHRIPTDNLEDEANRFASEFLMPRVDIIHDLRPFSLPRAVALKSKWKVSIASIVKRAYDLGVITKAKYSSLFREINYTGIRFKEPIELPSESPTLFKQMVTTCQNQLGYSIDDICKDLCILQKHFMKVLA